MENKETIISYSNCKDVAQKTDVKAIAISVILIAAGLYVSLAVTVDNPSSSLNILRIFSGWVLTAAGVCGLFFKRTHWAYTPSGSRVKQQTVEYSADQMDELRGLLASVTEEDGPRTGNISHVHLDYFASADGEYVALQVLQYGTFNDTPLTGIISLYGSRAADFLKLVRK